MRGRWNERVLVSSLLTTRLFSLFSELQAPPAKARQAGTADVPARRSQGATDEDEAPVAGHGPCHQCSVFQEA